MYTVQLNTEEDKDRGFLLYRQRLCIHVTLKTVLYSSAAKAADIEIKIRLLTLLSVLMLLHIYRFCVLLKDLSVECNDM